MTQQNLCAILDPVKKPGRIAYRVGLGAAVSVLVALTVSTLAGVTYLKTREALLKLTAERVDDLLHALSARVESHVVRAIPAVELSRALVANSLERRDANDLARHFALVIRTNPGFSWASYSDKDGNFTGAYRTPSGDLRISQSSIHNGRGDLREYSVDEKGRWSLAQHERKYNFDPRQDKFYPAAVSARKRVWVGPYIFYDEGIPGITCATPLFDTDGNALGVFTIDFDLQILSRFVADLRFGDSGRVFILTPGNQVVAHPMLRLVPTAGKGYRGELPSVSDISDPLLQAFVKSPSFHAAGRRPEAQFTLDSQGREYIAGRRVVEIDNGLTWILGVIAPADDFLWVVERNRDLAVVVAAASVAIGIFLAVLLARKITSPLTAIASEMQQVGMFHLDEHPPVNTLFHEVALMDVSLRKMKRGLRSFAYYVPTGLVRSVLESGQEATLAGEAREMTVYFSDIAGFTTKAEALPPEELVKNLSNYLDEMTKIIGSANGTIDKFIGDAIMAFWGAPVPATDHAVRACETAIRSQRRLAELRASTQLPWLADLHARIGIATGQMLVGNIGTCDRFNYTVMGDTVNLASRLEGLGKHYRTEILVSEETFEAAKGSVIARPIDLVQVKGRLHGVWVYELLCLASEEDMEVRRFASICTEAFSAYISRDFEQSAKRFREAMELRPSDHAAAMLLERSLQYVRSPPPDGWIGAYVAPDK